MVQVVSSTDPSSQAFLATDAETDPFAGMPFSGVGEEAAGASSGEIESLASDVITQLKTLSPETEAAIATSLSELFASVADQLNTVDLNDPAAVADLQASLSGIMALSLGETPTPEIDLLSGIADNANAALTLAAADPQPCVS